MSLFERNLHEAAQEDIRSALFEKLGNLTTLTRLTESIEAVMTDYDVPLTEALHWIALEVPGKRWTTAEFTRWCQFRKDTLERRNADAERRLPEGWPE